MSDDQLIFTIRCVVDELRRLNGLMDDLIKAVEKPSDD